MTPKEVAPPGDTLAPSDPSRPLWGLLSVLWLLAVVPSAFAALLSGMLFDAPGSERSLLTVALARALFVLPVAWLAGAGLPWVFRRRARARWLFLVPLLNLACIVGIGVAIHVLCGGKLVCTVLRW